MTSTESEHGMSGNQEQQTRPVAIVTGASGGIGEATARALHERASIAARPLPKAAPTLPSSNWAITDSSVALVGLPVLA